MSAVSQTEKNSMRQMSSGLPLKADLASSRRHFAFGPRLCENARTLDRDRTSYSFNAALAAQAASPFNFEIEPKNIILVALRVFEFPHSLGQKATCSRRRLRSWERPIAVQNFLARAIDALPEDLADKAHKQTICSTSIRVVDAGSSRGLTRTPWRSRRRPI